jgi:hypothetical protein
MIYKTLHRKLKIEQHEPHKLRYSWTEGLAIPAPLVTPVVLLLKTWTSYDTKVALDDSEWFSGFKSE